MMALITFFLFPLVIATLFILPEIFFLIKKIYKYKNEDKDKLEKKSKEILSYFKKKEKDNIPLEKLQESRQYILYHIWFLLRSIAILFIFPIFLLRMALILRFGIQFIWKLPVNLYELWFLSFLCISFYLANINNITLALSLAILVASSALYLLASGFEKKSGKLELLKRPKHKLNLTEPIQTGVILVLSFASIYYSICKIDPTFFSKELTILDSIYYSVITVATVGFGDITPVKDLSKFITILEIFLGFLYIAFVISIFINIWLKRNISSNKDNSVN